MGEPHSVDEERAEAMQAWRSAWTLCSARVDLIREGLDNQTLYTHELRDLGRALDKALAVFPKEGD